MLMLIQSYLEALFLTPGYLNGHLTSPFEHLSSIQTPCLRQTSDILISLFFLQTSLIQNKHATYPPSTQAETWGSLLTCNQNLSIYHQNTTRIHSVSFLILSYFAASDILSIYLKVSLRELTNLVETACSSCLLNTLTSWNFFSMILMDIFFSFLYQILYYLCSFTFSFLVSVEASTSSFLRKVKYTV